MTARVLVAYASKLGSNAEIAEAIAQVLREAGHHASAVAVRDVKAIEGWDAVVLGSAIYAAHWQKDARKFVARLHAELEVRPLWLWASGPLDERQARSNLPITAHGASITGDLGARDHRTFGGRLAPDAAIDPQVLATHPIGDFRDFDAIRAYAREIAAALTHLGPDAGATGLGGTTGDADGGATAPGRDRDGAVDAASDDEAAGVEPVDAGATGIEPADA